MVTIARAPLGVDQLQEGIEQGYDGLDGARAAGVASLLRIRTAKRQTLERDLRKAREARDERAIAALTARIEQNTRLVAALAHDQAVSKTPSPQARADGAIVHGYVWRADGPGLEPAPKLRVGVFLAQGDEPGEQLGEDVTQDNGYFRIAVPVHPSASVDVKEEAFIREKIDATAVSDVPVIVAVSDSRQRDPAAFQRLLLNPGAVIFCELVMP